MRIISTQAMQSSDRTTIEDFKIPGKLLMESAAQACTQHMLAHYLFQTVSVLAGPGNNGGDGYAIARHLCLNGKKVRVFEAHQEGSEDRIYHRELLKELPVQLEGLAAWLKTEQTDDLVVDSLFGIGLNREISAEFKRCIEKLNSISQPVVSIDIPSGVNGDTGEVLGCAARADSTISFEAAKPGHFLKEGMQLRGKLTVAPIGIKLSNTSMRKLSYSDLEWPEKQESSHKASTCRVVAVGGEPGKSGAIQYSAKAAFQSGVGLVTVQTQKESIPFVQGSSPEIMCLELEDKVLAESAYILGPGAGHSAEFQNRMREILEADLPAVIDADAFSIYNPRQWQEVLRERKSSTILTPHPGEQGRISPQVLNGYKDALEFAGSCNVSLLLKDSVSILVHGDGELDILPFPNAALAKGGSGDILAGLCAGALSFGLDQKEALRQAVLLHSISGFLLRMCSGANAAMPSEHLQKIREVLAQYEKGDPRYLSRLESTYYECGLAPAVLDLT